MRWSGNPQIGVRLPPHLFQAVRGEARLRGVPASHILRRLIQDWYQHGITAAPDHGQDRQAGEEGRAWMAAVSPHNRPPPRSAPMTLAEMVLQPARAPFTTLGRPR